MTEEQHEVANEIASTLFEMKRSNNINALGCGMCSASNRAPLGTAMRQALTEIEKAEKDSGNVDGALCSVDQSGRWVSITMDSGAAESVIPEGGDFADIPTLETDRSTQAKKQGGYRTASGEPIPNKGEQQLQMITREGLHRGMRFQKTGVQKILASVSRICEYGHRVVFEKGNSRIEDVISGDRIDLEERQGLYVLEAWVPWGNGEWCKNMAGFPRRGK